MDGRTIALDHARELAHGSSWGEWGRDSWSMCISPGCGFSSAILRSYVQPLGSFRGKGGLRVVVWDCCKV